MTAAPLEHERWQPESDGNTFGGFRLMREIARGGMATVYLGQKYQHAGIRQVAAFKLIHPHLAQESDFVDMFLDEARIVSCINHPNVCRILDFGMSEDTYYLAMEYVLGETWANVMARLLASPKTAGLFVPVLVQVLAQACEGLHAAHEAQDALGSPLRIVHRDVSPQNLMVGYDGGVRVLDFGIASAVDRLHSTRHGQVKGRLSYMAPEQMLGLPIDRRADVWSLGVILWEGLARRRLFRRDNEAETVLAVTQKPIPSLADCGYPVPDSLEKIVTRALQRDRTARYASARELGVELWHCLKSTAFAMPEVSDWMHYMFAAELDRKRALLREVADEVGEFLPYRSRTDRTDNLSGESERQATPTKPGGRNRSIVSEVRPTSRRGVRRLGRVMLFGTTLLTAVSLSLVGAEPASDSAPWSQPAEHTKKPSPISDAELNPPREGVHNDVPKADESGTKGIAAASSERNKKIEADLAFGARALEEASQADANRSVSDEVRPQLIRVGAP